MTKLQQEKLYIPLDSEGNIQVVDVDPISQEMNDTFHNGLKSAHKTIED